MGKKGEPLFLLVEFKGEPFPKIKKQRVPLGNWVVTSSQAIPDATFIPKRQDLYMKPSASCTPGHQAAKLVSTLAKLRPPTKTKIQPIDDTRREHGLTCPVALEKQITLLVGV